MVEPWRYPGYEVGEPIEHGDVRVVPEDLRSVRHDVPFRANVRARAWLPTVWLGPAGPPCAPWDRSRTTVGERVMEPVLYPLLFMLAVEMRLPFPFAIIEFESVRKMIVELGLWEVLSSEAFARPVHQR